MLKIARLTSIALAMGLATTCLAGEKDDIKKMTIGDEAPSIDIAHWLKMDDSLEGEALTEFESGKVYVVEFWATWCGPCRASMPHITKLQEQYRDYDVTVISVSDEPLPTVVNFLTKKDKEGTLWNDKIGYTLTTDPDRSVYNSYMKAAFQRGIPTSFIIGKDGHVEWIGHPMNMDRPLDQVVRDKWDRTAYKAEFEMRQEVARKQMEAEEAIARAIKAERWDEAIKQCWDDSMSLNQIAWMIATEEVKNRDLDVALKAADRASELTEHENPAVLDTVARVYFEKGDLKNALKWQKKAVKFAGDDEMGADLKKSLEMYQKAAGG